MRALWLVLALAPPAAVASDDWKPNRRFLSRDLPEWLTLGTELRLRWEDRRGLRFDPENNDGYLVTRFRINLGIEPSRHFGVFVQAQDSRGLKLDSSRRNNQRNVFDIRQGYVRIGDEDGLWDLKAGRMRMSLGNERLLGRRDWSNTSPVHDVVKLAVHDGENRVDLFASSNVIIDDGAFDKHVDGNNYHGIYGSLGSLISGTKIEPYLTQRTLTRVVGEDGAAGGATIYTAGARAQGSTAWGWDFEIDYARQFGSFANDDVRAWVTTLAAGYTFQEAGWKPRIHGEFNYASGDEKFGDGVRGLTIPTFTVSTSTTGSPTCSGAATPGTSSPVSISSPTTRRWCSWTICSSGWRTATTHITDTREAYSFRAWRAALQAAMSGTSLTCSSSTRFRRNTGWGEGSRGCSPARFWRRRRRRRTARSGTCLSSSPCSRAPTAAVALPRALAIR